MSKFDEILILQDRTMSTISRALSNFKKLGQAKWTAPVVRHRIENLKALFTECRSNDAKLHFVASADQKAKNPYFTSNLFVQCEELYEEASDYMIEALGTVEAVPSPTAHSTLNQTMASRPSSHLPRLGLPSFDGSLRDWETFRDRFRSLIHNDQSLSNVDRLHYLLTCVTGDASRALSHLAVTDANYETALTILTSRYENKRRLIHTHLRALCTLPTLTSESYTDLQNLRDTMNSSIQALKNLRRPVDTWDDFLVYQVTERLDKHTRKAWELKLGDSMEYPSYSELDKFLETRLRALEAVSTSSGSPTNYSNSRTITSNRAKSFVSLNTIAKPSSNSLGTPGTPKGVTPLTIKCPICKDNHLLSRCPTFLSYTPSHRYETVTTQQRCLNCLSKAHSVEQCVSIYRCRVCSSNHHTLLHDVCEGSSSSSSGPDSRSSNAENTVVSHTLAPIAPFTTSVLLATARVRVCTPQGRWKHVRAMIDTGSVATLITDQLARSLRLQRKSHPLRLAGIGGTEAAARHTAAIQVSPINRSTPSYGTNAVVVANLTQYAPHRIHRTAQWSHTHGLNLADSDPFSSDPINVIIGADLYGHIVRRGQRKGKWDEPTAQNTVFGWILSGRVSRNNSATTVSCCHGSVIEDLDVNRHRSGNFNRLPTSKGLSKDMPEGETHCQLPIKRKTRVEHHSAKIQRLTANTTWRHNSTRKTTTGRTSRSIIKTDHRISNTRQWFGPAWSLQDSSHRQSVSSANKSENLVAPTPESNLTETTDSQARSSSRSKSLSGTTPGLRVTSRLPTRIKLQQLSQLRQENQQQPRIRPPQQNQCYQKQQPVQRLPQLEQQQQDQSRSRNHKQRHISRSQVYHTSAWIQQQSTIKPQTSDSYFPQQSQHQVSYSQSQQH